MALIPYIVSTNGDLLNTWSTDTKYGPLYAGSIFLIPPTFLLVALSPYSIRLATSLRPTIGSTAGTLYFLATVGNIIGTFLAVFVLISTFDIRQNLEVPGIVLILISIIGLGKILKRISSTDEIA